MVTGSCFFFVHLGSLVVSAWYACSVGVWDVLWASAKDQALVAVSIEKLRRCRGKDIPQEGVSQWITLIILYWVGQKVFWVFKTSYGKTQMNFWPTQHLAACSLFTLFYWFILHLFLAALGLCCWIRAFSVTANGGSYSLVAVHGRFIVVASPVVEHGLSCPTAQGSSWTRDRTCVLCIGRQILNRWTCREALNVHFKLSERIVLGWEQP